MGLAQDLQRAIQALAVECDDTYAMAYRVEDMLEEIFDDHEAQLKEANRIKEAFRNLSLELNIEASELRAQMKAKDEEIKALKKECEYDQRNASMSQKESVEHLAEIERLKVELKHYKELASDLDNELRNVQWELSDLKDTK